MYFLFTRLGAKTPVWIPDRWVSYSVLLFLSFLIWRKYLPPLPWDPPSSHIQALLVVHLLCDPTVSWAGNAAENKTEKNACLQEADVLGGRLPECSLNYWALCTVKEFPLLKVIVSVSCVLQSGSEVTEHRWANGGPKQKGGHLPMLFRLCYLWKEMCPSENLT